ncbi:DUF881 domain-containing protein [Clostridium tetanomorphum]|uniref:DUF881 domain-containing protein n=1 Tax=Clostridium tetanomorphum TaxID=1553 RepID=A0A923E7Q8_CLOTT|nr:DUF881 domain-containing protein [Clostridium tetanomorphum]MBC2396619.1 DUF881 domain-containing protein [Clostridium tetanomorphum]NRZ98243.1 uncharacterized protein YlxW (UPF0749 family) [Clostridium tetanomorphum]
MRKWSSQVSVALVCAILGFMLAYQFKMLFKQDRINVNPYNSADITAQIEQYKKEKEKLNTRVNELETKIKAYEDAAAGRDDSTKTLLKELEDTRILTGTTDVEGEGIIIYLTPNSNIFGSGTDFKITDRHLIILINELKYAGAEAISINDIRITGRTGIRISGNTISINGEDRVSPSKRIVIKAIGYKKNLEAVLEFPETLSDFRGVCEVKYEPSDNIKIDRYNKSYKFEYAKPVK